ncbi:unnamed protein product, partial [Effrenium voratum]
SHLRIIEMAWPRAKEGTKPTGGKASAALEQVLQSKLSGAPAVYRASPLALLLKPCLEGASSLCFIHCMRLDQPHLGCLATAAPLLAKLYLWLGQERKARARGGSPLARRVPPLQLSGSTGGSCTLTNTDSQLSAVDTQPSCTPTSSSRSSCSQKQPVAIAASISEESSVLTGGGEGGTGEASAAGLRTGYLAAIHGKRFDMDDRCGSYDLVIWMNLDRGACCNTKLQTVDSGSEQNG